MVLVTGDDDGRGQRLSSTWACRSRPCVAIAFLPFEGHVPDIYTFGIMGFPRLMIPHVYATEPFFFSFSFPLDRTVCPSPIFQPPRFCSLQPSHYHPLGARNFSLLKASSMFTNENVCSTRVLVSSTHDRSKIFRLHLIQLLREALDL